MATGSADYLMMFEKGGNAVPGEGQAEIDTKDPLMKGFAKGRFFHVQDFDFGISVVDSDSPATDTRSNNGGKTKTTGRFSKWIQGLNVSTGQGTSGSLYPIEMEPFSFTRQVDLASPVLFYNCFQTKPFDSATLVRRKMTGTALGSNNITSLPFLRIEFSSVLLISVDWDGDEEVKEKCKFVCRSVKVQYRPQRPDGSPGDPIGGDWLSLKKTTA